MVAIEDVKYHSVTGAVWARDYVLSYSNVELAVIARAEENCTFNYIHASVDLECIFALQLVSWMVAQHCV